jgi:transposase
MEREARAQALNQEQRHARRLEQAKPLLEVIRSRIEAARTSALPKSALAKACNYALSLWTRLSRFLDYPELELSNNWAENAMRPVALGRKNWIHVGSEQAGPRVAAILSVVETCRRLKIPLRDYLGSVLPGLANFPISRIAELTPSAWAARN